MTWAEFKNLVDKQIEDQNLDPDFLIWYIDVSFPDPGGVSVAYDEGEGFYIWSSL